MAADHKPALPVRELWVAACRHRVLMAAVFAGVITVFGAFALMWPATYESSGTILIEQQEVPSDLVRSTVSGYADQRIQTIRQQVMTRANLTEIIERYDLYEEPRRTRAIEAVIDRVRDDITFRTIAADVIDPRSGNPTKATIAFALGFRSRDPGTASKVANELITLFLQRNIEDREKSAAEANAFLEEESRRLQQTIDGLQAKVAAFKQEHAGELPELAQLNLQLLHRLDDESRDLDAQIRSVEQNIIYLDAQLAQLNPIEERYSPSGERIMTPSERLKALRTEQARARALYSDNHPDVVRLDREIASLEATVGDARGNVDQLHRQLADARAELDRAREHYAADHPDVVRLERLVASLEDDAARLPRSSAQGSLAIDADNPQYIQMSAQREAAASEGEALKEERIELQGRLHELEQRLARAPAVERDYLALDRELDNAQLKYREVRQKQMEAQLSQNLEEKQKGERFELIESPLTPQRPSSPNRMLILALGLFVASGSAVGVAALRETTDTSIRGRRDLTSLLNVPPLAVVPHIRTQYEAAASRRARLFWMTGSVVAVLATIAAVHAFYKPLDVLWYAVMRRFFG